MLIDHSPQRQLSQERARHSLPVVEPPAPLRVPPPPPVLLGVPVSIPTARPDIDLLVLLLVLLLTFTLALPNPFTQLAQNVCSNPSSPFWKTSCRVHAFFDAKSVLNLETVIVDDSVTETDIKKLEQALPNCQIHRFGDGGK